MARRLPNPASGNAHAEASSKDAKASFADPFACFHPVTAEWFKAVFDAPTAPQTLGWPVIARGESALILAPTGTGKTLTAFLWCIDRLMLTQGSGTRDQGTATAVGGCRILYISPLKALAVDVERNLRSPLAGIANMARRRGVDFREPTISVRTGDTPQRDRARFLRHPADILITTPESLYLMLTSQASEALRTVDTVIIDEIHALVPTKRGAHMALTLERLEALTDASTGRRLQRIGLSATQRPLEEVARFLGGVEVQRTGNREQGSGVSAGIRDQVSGIRGALAADIVPPRVLTDDEALQAAVLNASESAAKEARIATTAPLTPDPCALIPGSPPGEPRPVTIVNASAPKKLKLRIEVPVEDMARLGEQELIPSGPASQAPKRVSIWSAIHPRLLELIRARNSTILFVNSRQVAERLAGALNELAGENIARAHHGSLAASQRTIIEEELKAGQIRALCATSTLELGIDMGAVDLVIQIEAPPSVASGMQRIGRAGHSVDAVSEGILFPKYRADLVACAAVTRAMHEGHIESTRFPRNPLDVLCQQIVAIVAHPPGVVAPRKPKPLKKGTGSRKGLGVSVKSPGLSANGTGLSANGMGLSVKAAGFSEKGTGLSVEGTGFSLKGTGLSPYINLPGTAGASAPEGISTSGQTLGAPSIRRLSDEWVGNLDPQSAETPYEPAGAPDLNSETGESTKPEVNVDALYNLVRSAAPFATLTRAAFDGVLDLLSGRYPSDEFAELRPRLTWDRIRNVVTARDGSLRLAILNAGTIPDRGLYGVFLAHTDGKAVRVGELDEEMVFESRPGETFILGASTWRIVEITFDRVLVTPAAGEPGKMPFWKGDGPGRPLEFGRRIGALVRELRALPKPAALTRLVAEHDLDPGAAENLIQFLADQEASTGSVPDDRTIVIERCRDELGDWRVCVLTPFGSRIHIPWAMAVSARIRAAGGPEVEALWGDDGFVLRFPDTAEPPDSDWFLVESAEAMQLVLRQLGTTALFAGRFREAAGRALLLPRRRADARTPLWQLRKRAYDLLSVASRYPSFPLLLEAYRECLRDVFDMPALIETLRAIEQRQLRVHVVDTRKPSPFSSSLLFSYVANYIYDGDAPLAERRAQALTIDQDQLRELLGEADLRELLDADAIAEVEEIAQCLVDPHRARSADGIHDLCLRLGDLSRDEISRRVVDASLLESLDRLLRARRLLEIRIAGEKRIIAAEDAARYRDALGIPLPPGLAAALLEPVAYPVLELVRRYARTHGPFTLREPVGRFGLDAAVVENALRQLMAEGRILEGGFIPGGQHREWCDAEMLRLIRRKSLAKLRREVEPVEQHTLARFLTHWQGLVTPRRTGHGNLDGLLDAVESLQGAPLPASLVESAILPARIAEYAPAGLDTLIAAGEVAWAGVEPMGERDGRIALFLSDKLPLLAQQRPQTDPLTEREEKIVAVLASSGASFFDPLHQALGGGYPGETIEALWSLVWRGLITNDSLHALRAYTARPDSARTPRRVQTGIVFRSRRTTPPTAQGRWSLLPQRTQPGSSGSHIPLRAPSIRRSSDEWVGNLEPELANEQKGTGFSPYIDQPSETRASAPEGNSPNEPLHGAPSIRRSSDEWVGNLEPTPATVSASEPNPTGEQKGTGFSPYIDQPSETRASAPEGNSPNEPLHGAPSIRRSSDEWVGNLEPTPATVSASEPNPTTDQESSAFSVKGTGFSVKGTGFSPYIQDFPNPGASAPEATAPTTTEASHALALQLLHRYGVLLREHIAAENIPGGFSAVYPVLKALEESGRIRRGYFVAGLGATQFALPAAVDLLRQLRTGPPDEKPEFVQLAAADPANPYGSVLPWPDLPVAEEDAETAPRVLTRAAYAEVILRNGQLIAWLRRGNPNLLVFLPAEEPERSQAAAGLAQFLAARGQDRLRSASQQGVLITTINGQPIAAHPMARFLMDAGFHPGPLGMHLRRIPGAFPQREPAQPEPREVQ